MAVVVVAVGSAAFAVTLFLTGQGGDEPSEAKSGTSAPTASAKASDRAAVPLVQPDTLETALEGQGFSCYRTVTDPVEGRSCYRSESDGIQVTVRILSDAQGKVARVTAHTDQASAIGSDTRPHGDAAPPMRELVPTLAKVLLGPEASKVPSAEIEAEGRRQVDIGWGTVAFDIRPEVGMADFSRQDAPDLPPDAAFAKDIPVMQAGLKAAGYDCEDRSCHDPDSSGARVTFSGRDVTMTVERDDGAKVDDAELKKRFGTLLTAVAGHDAKSAVDAWLGTHVKPAHGSALADIAGVHVELVRNDAAATLVLTPVSME